MHMFFGVRPSRLPLSIGDPDLVSGATAAVSISDMFMNYLQGGRIEAAFLGAAQIDRFGNMNTTVVGDYTGLRVRLPGSGGPQLVVTDKAVFDFEDGSGEMILRSRHPGVTQDLVKAQVDWRLRVATELRASQPPTTEELCIIRDELDPQLIYTGEESEAR